MTTETARNRFILYEAVKVLHEERDSINKLIETLEEIQRCSANEKPPDPQGREALVREVRPGTPAPKSGSSSYHESR